MIFKSADEVSVVVSLPSRLVSAGFVRLFRLLDLDDSRHQDYHRYKYYLSSEEFFDVGARRTLEFTNHQDQSKDCEHTQHPCKSYAFHSVFSWNTTDKS